MQFETVEIPQAASPAAFVEGWRQRARASARTGSGRVLAWGRGRVWRLSGRRAVPAEPAPQEEDLWCDPADLAAGAVLFREGEPVPGLVTQGDKDQALLAALAGDAIDPEVLAGEADGPRGGLSWLKLRTLARFGGLTGAGLDDLCARFAWREGETEAPAAQAVAELSRLLGEGACFAAGPRWQGGLSGPPEALVLRPASLSASQWCQAKALVDLAGAEADADAVLREAARTGGPFRATLDVLARLRQAADAIAPGNYAQEHAALVEEAGAAASPEALASHPHLLLRGKWPAGWAPSQSLRGTISVRLGEGFVPEAVVPTGEGTFTFSGPDLFGMGGDDELRESALAAWAGNLLASGLTPEQASSRLAPFCVPSGRPTVAAHADGSLYAVRPEVPAAPESPLSYRAMTFSDAGPWRPLGSPARPAYDEALEDLLGVLPAGALTSDPLLSRLQGGGVRSPDGTPQARFCTATVGGRSLPALAVGEAVVVREGLDYAVRRGGTLLGTLPSRGQALACAIAVADCAAESAAAHFAAAQVDLQAREGSG